MTDSDRQVFKLKAQVAKALAHESRLIILDALRERDLCVGELADLVEGGQATASKHLSVLKNAGIVTDRKEGNKVFYHLETPCVLDFFQCAMEVIQRRSRIFRVIT